MKTNKTKTWTKEEITNILKTNDSQLIRALEKLYDYQTRTEQIVRDTKYNNNVGFNGTDGKFLSSLTTYYKRFGKLSSKQVYCLRKRMLKYAGQLARIANGELEMPAEQVLYTPKRHYRQPRKYGE